LCFVFTLIEVPLQGCDCSSCEIVAQHELPILIGALLPLSMRQLRPDLAGFLLLQATDSIRKQLEEDKAQLERERAALAAERAALEAAKKASPVITQQQQQQPQRRGPFGNLYPAFD
jgi:hypothetical protein